MNERKKHGDYVSAVEYITAYNRMDNKEQALAWLDKAVQERSGFVFQVRVHPSYDRLRDDPAYTELIGKIGVKS